MLGICGSGSFVISAAKIDPRMKAIATVSMYDMGAAFRNGLKHARDARAAQGLHPEGDGGSAWSSSPAARRSYIPGTVNELTENTDPIQREFFDFYRTSRGAYTPKGSRPS